MDVAIIGATGSCGRQTAAQILERALLPSSARLQLIGHRGGAHETELWGIRADLSDAFGDEAPTIELALDAADADADVVIMLAGVTIATDPSAPVDRAALARSNRVLFQETAQALAGARRATTVIVQSNPVELAVDLLASALSRHRVLGAAAWSDSLRFRRELARDLGVRRPMVQAEMWGQHGDHLVPIWSQIRVRGIDPDRLSEAVAGFRAGRSLADLPREIQEAKGRMLALVREGRIGEALQAVQSLPPDLRAAVTPFFTHFTAGRTTEMATAHSVVDILAALARGQRQVVPAQVDVGADWPGLSGVLGVPVTLDPTGWSRVVRTDVAADEWQALHGAVAAVSSGSAEQPPHTATVDG